MGLFIVVFFATALLGARIVAQSSAANLAACPTGDLDDRFGREVYLEDTIGAIHSALKSVPTWQSSANRYERIASAVFILGLLTAGLQLERLRKQKGMIAAVAIIGLAVSGLTGWMERGFAADHKGYRKAVLQVERIVCQLKPQMNLFLDKFARTASVTDPEAAVQVAEAKLSFINEKILPLSNRLSELETNLVAYSYGSPFGLTAYAEASSSWSGTGIGQCNVLTQSEENSSIAANERLVAMLAEKNAGTDRNALREFVAQYSTRTQYQDKQQFRTTVALNPTFANPKILTPYLDAKRRSVTPVSTPAPLSGVKSKLPAWPNQEVTHYLETTATVDSKGITLRKDPKDGWFVFRFATVPDKAGRRVRLQSVNIVEDASQDSTRWSFYVLHDGKVIMELPLQRWNDAGQPTTCTMDPAAWLSTPLPNRNDPVRLTVIGLKSEVSSSAKSKRD
jgi:hypothetical protein